MIDLFQWSALFFIDHQALVVMIKAEVKVAVGHAPPNIMEEEEAWIQMEAIIKQSSTTKDTDSLNCPVEHHCMILNPLHHSIHCMSEKTMWRLSKHRVKVV